MTVNEEKEAFSSLINLYRRRSGLDKLKRAPALDTIATQRAGEIEYDSVGSVSLTADNEAVGVCTEYDSVTLAFASLFSIHGENSDALAGNWSHFGVARVNSSYNVKWFVVFANAESFDGEYMPSATEYYNGIGIIYEEKFTGNYIAGGALEFGWKYLEWLEFEASNEGRRKFEEFSKVIVVKSVSGGIPMGEEYGVTPIGVPDIRYGGKFFFRIPEAKYFKLYNLPGNGTASPMRYRFDKYPEALPDYCVKVSDRYEEIDLRKEDDSEYIITEVKYQGVFFRFRDTLTDGRPRGNISCTFARNPNDREAMTVQPTESNWIWASDRRGLTKTNVNEIERFSGGVENASNFGKILGLWFNNDPPGYAKLTTDTVDYFEAPEIYPYSIWSPPLNAFVFRHIEFTDIVFNFTPIIIGFQALAQNNTGNAVNASGVTVELKCLTNGDFSNVQSDYNITVDNATKTISWITADAPVYIKYLPIGNYEITDSNGKTGSFTISDSGAVANPVDIFWDGSNKIVKIYSRMALNYPTEREYITIYDFHTKQNQFNTHGLAVLSPTKCTITEVFNGKYELYIEHPVDEYNKWQYIRENNIIKALGQLFTLKIVEYNFDGGKKYVIGRAEHIFYQQNDWWIFPDSPKLYILPNYNVASLIDIADTFASKYIAEGQTWYNFEWSSDLTIPSSYLAKEFSKADGTSFMEYITGSGGLLEVSGGELYRDNFHFSINTKMENSNDNAFEIRIGKNLTGVKRTVDLTTVCTYFKGYDDLGCIVAVSWDEASVLMVNMPHSVTRSKHFSYELDKEMSEQEKIDTSFSYLERDVLNFFEENCKPLISFEVSLEDVENNDDFKEFQNKPEYKVGNSGIIYDERLGGAVKLKITQTVKDAITGKTTSVLFGTNRNFTHNSYHSVIDIPAEISGEAILFDADGEIVLDANSGKITVKV